MVAHSRRVLAWSLGLTVPRWAEALLVMKITRLLSSSRQLPFEIGNQPTTPVLSPGRRAGTFLIQGPIPL